MQPVLLPSPLLGPAVWQPVAEVLRARGWSVTVAPLVRGVGSAADVQRVYDKTVADVAAPLLVAHSNAGLYVPWLAARHRPVGAVFVDAGLPVGGNTVPLAPAAFYELLTSMADESRILPPWTEWWSGSDLQALIPDAALRAAVSAEAQRLPLSYFDESLPVPAGWDAMPCAYLASGDTYAPERDDAVGRGWSVRTMAGGHLHMLVEPESVADALEGLSPL